MDDNGANAETAKRRQAATRAQGDIRGHARTRARSRTHGRRTHARTGVSPVSIAHDQLRHLPSRTGSPQRRSTKTAKNVKGDSDQDLVARLAGCGEACMQPIHLRGGGGASLRRRGHRIGRARARERTLLRRVSAAASRSQQSPMERSAPPPRALTHARTHTARAHTHRHARAHTHAHTHRRRRCKTFLTPKDRLQCTSARARVCC